MERNEEYEGTGVSSDQESQNNDISSLKYEIDALKEQNRQLLSSFSQAKAQIEPEIDENIFKDPKLAAQYIKQQAMSAKADVQREAKKQQWDAKAYEEFPSIKNDKKFKDAVIKKARELVEVDGRNPEDPTLLYRAAESVAFRFINKAEDKKQTRDFETSNEEVRGVGARSSTGVTNSKFKLSEADPRVQFAKMAGLDKNPKIWKKLEERLQELGPHQRVERKQARRIK